MRKFLIVVFTLFLFSACTDNQRARNFGGSESIRLEPNERFVNITWKGEDLWIVVQDTSTGTFYAREKSSFGILQGRVVIQH